MSTMTYATPKPLSRRSFLQSTAAAGAALTLPGAAWAQAEGQLLDC